MNDFNLTLKDLIALIFDSLPEAGSWDTWLAGQYCGHAHLAVAAATS